MKLSDAEKITTEDEARQFAIDYQDKFSESTMFMSEVVEWQNAIEKLGEKFNLTDEFRENGVI